MGGLRVHASSASFMLSVDARGHMWAPAVTFWRILVYRAAHVGNVRASSGHIGKVSSLTSAMTLVIAAWYLTARDHNYSSTRLR